MSQPKFGQTWSRGEERWIVTEVAKVFMRGNRSITMVRVRHNTKGPGAMKSHRFELKNFLDQFDLVPKKRKSPTG